MTLISTDLNGFPHIASVEGIVPETQYAVDLKADRADCQGGQRPDPPPSSIESGAENEPRPADERQLSAAVEDGDETFQLGRWLRSRNGGSRRTCFQSGDGGRVEVKSATRGEARSGGNSDYDGSRDDDPSDKDYADDTDTASADVEQLPPPAARRRLYKSMDCEADAASRNAGENSLADSANPSDQGIGQSSSVSTRESAEIPIRGFMTLKTFKSEVVYCLTFSQELSLYTHESVTGDGSQGEGRMDKGRPPRRDSALCRTGKRCHFSSDDDALLVQLKEKEGLSWDEITDHFPGRSKGALQVHYCTKLKQRPERLELGRKRRRFG